MIIKRLRNKKLVLLLLLCLIFIIGCKTRENLGQSNNIIQNRYGNDIISNEKIALKYAELIFNHRYKNVDFSSFKPFEISSIENGKVWYVIAKKKTLHIYEPKYSIKINKNTAEILELKKEK